LAAAVGDDVVRRAQEWLGVRAAGPGGAARPAAVREVEPYRPFPVAALPAPLAEYVHQESGALGCDPAFVALPVLAAAAAAIGNTRVLRLKRGWEEPAVLWTAVVADSGTLKSPAHSKAVAPLYRRQQQLLDDYQAALERYQQDLAAYNDARRGAAGAGAAPGAPPPAPVLARVVCSDTTIEKLAEILADNPRGTLLARDEQAGWFGSFTRYKGKQGGTDLPHWLEMFRAGPVLVDRKTGDRKTLFVPHAAVSVCGGIQPGVLARALTPEFLEAGLAARLLMAMPPKRAKRWTEAEVDPGAEHAYGATLDALLALDFTVRDGERAPHALGLSDDAKAAWVAFYDE
jgi:hypothetical protein